MKGKKIIIEQFTKGGTYMQWDGFITHKIIHTLHKIPDNIVKIEPKTIKIKPVPRPKYLYHVTPVDNLQLIAKEGIKPKPEPLIKGHVRVNLWGSIEDARRYCETYQEGDQAIIQIDIPSNIPVYLIEPPPLPYEESPLEEFKEWYAVYQTILPQYIKIVEYCYGYGEY